MSLYWFLLSPRLSCFSCRVPVWMPTVRRLIRTMSNSVCVVVALMIVEISSVVSFCFFHVSSGKIEDCTDDPLNEPDARRCSRKSTFAKGLFLVYALITTIMLINLLIAIFRFCSTLSSLPSCSLTCLSPSSGSVLRFHHYNHAH